MTKVTKSVLLIDDCLEDRETYRRYLLRDQQHTYRILEAETGEQALQVCQQQFPDVIVMDYLLPDVDGLEFLDNLKTQFGQTSLPVIILTGRGNEQIAVQAMKSGAADYLVKKHTTAVSLRLAVENVLEKTRLSRQLLESEQRFQATFNQVAVGIAHVGLDGQWLLVNQKLCDIVGYTREELNQLTLQDITHPNDRNLDLEYVVRMLTGEIQTYSLEKRYIRQDNTHIWINLTVSLVREVSGEPQYFICVVEDITPRKQAQAALQQAHSELERRVQQRTSELQQANQELQITLEELQVTEQELRSANEELAISHQAIELQRQHYQNLFEFAPDGYLVTDTWGNIREANRAAATLLSIQQQRLIGKPLLVFIAEPERQAFRTRLAQLQEVQGWEVYLQPRKGDPFPAMVAVTSIHDEQGQQVGWRWLLRDIRIRKQMEQRLQAGHDQLEKRVEARTAELSRTNTLLQQKNELLQAIFDHVPVMLALFDPNGQLRWANREWETVLGWRCEDIQGRDLLAEFYPDADYRQYVIDYITAADRRWGDFKTRTWDGRVLDTSWANVRLSDGSNIGIGKDISDRKQAEEALRRSEEQRRLVLDLTHTGFWDWNITTGEIIWNDNHYHLLGLIPNSVEASYQTWRDRVHPEDIDRVEQAVNYALDTQSEYETEYRVIHPDGSHHWVMARGRGLYDESGQAVRMVGMVFDISDRKQAQEKIQEQAALLDVTTDAIFVRDLECRVLYWNPGAERMYGWQAAEVLSKDCCEFLYKEISPSLQESLRTVVEQGEWRGELNKITKSGQEIIVSSRWTLMRDEAGQPKSIFAVDTDITEKKHLEAQFYRAQRLESLGTLASGIAHDLNNILTPILTVAQLLRLKFPNLNEQNRQLLKILEDNSKRGAELVKQITAFARGAEGKHVPLQLRHLLKEIERIVKSTFPKSIEICINIATPNLWTVSADPTQIHQVLMNLCVNARDAMPDWGTLSISAENFHVDQNYAKMNLEAKVGDYVVITVSDTGCGMPQEVLERIFEPFFTTKEPGKGTGLGLSTVIGIIKNHGGFVNVHSQVGKGSHFQVFLPAIEKRATQSAEDLQMARGNGELILVVDDEAFVRDVAKTSLEEFNYRVLVGSDGIEAFSLYVQHKNEISVVLMDIQMPSIDGLNAIRILQQMNPSVKIIAISGLASNRKLLKISSIGVQAFLSKPYTIKELLDTIQDVLSEGVRG